MLKIRKFEIFSRNFAKFFNHRNSNSNLKNSPFCPTKTFCPIRLLSVSGSNFSNFSQNSQIFTQNFSQNFIKNPQIWDFPSTSGGPPICLPEKTKILDFGPENFLEFFEPSKIRKKIFDPRPKIKIHAIRMIIIRHKKMKKHQRKKRWKRDRHLKMKKQFLKKQRAEREFRQKCFALILDAMNFDAKEHLQETLRKVKWKPPENLTPDGKRIYPHWTELMTIEKLYGIPETDYIDKNACLASEEDWAEIRKLRQKYETEFRLKNKKNQK